MKRWHVVPRAVVEQDPLLATMPRPMPARLRGNWARHALDGLRGGLVELEVLVQIRGPEDWNVGSFQMSKYHLRTRLPRTAREVERQVADQRRPFFVGLWRVMLPSTRRQSLFR